MENQRKFLLLGGNGFLGKGLQDEFIRRGITFKSLDIADCDLTAPNSVEQLKNAFQKWHNVVLLASKVGVRTFKTNPYRSYDDNNKIFNNVKCAILKNGQPINIAYYSSCEIFGSRTSKDEFITLDSDIRPINSDRGLYAKGKIESENEIIRMHSLFPSIFAEYKIFRPFNISGKYQRRGVVFDMVKDAVTKQQITCCRDTTRTFTSIDFASKRTCDILTQHGNGVYHLVDDQNSVYISTLAKIVRSVLEDDYGIHDIDIIEMEPDNDVQFRNVSVVDLNIDCMRVKLKKIISDILEGRDLW